MCDLRWANNIISITKLFQELVIDYIRGMGPRISADIRGIDPGHSSGDILGQCHGYLRISRRRQQVMKKVN